MCQLVEKVQCEPLHTKLCDTTKLWLAIDDSDYVM